MNFIRLIVFGFIGLSVLYVIIGFYSRSIHREKLEKEWAEDHPAGSDPQAREDFIDQGMKAYEKSFRPKLVALVYVVPIIFVLVALAFNTWS